MRRFAVAMVLIAIASVAARAAIGDFRVGSFGGTWCNSTARFDIDSREGGRWIFHGRVLIVSTGEYDQLWVEQYSDNSLRIIRYLSGGNTGRTQVVQTSPPSLLIVNGQQISRYHTVGGEGLGCSAGAATWIDVPE